MYDWRLCFYRCLIGFTHPSHWCYIASRGYPSLWSQIPSGGYLKSGQVVPPDRIGYSSLDRRARKRAVSASCSHAGGLPCLENINKTPPKREPTSQCEGFFFSQTTQAFNSFIFEQRNKNV